MNVGYEEKTFEIYFNMELSKQGFIFPFGQAQEGTFGTDASANLPMHSALWNILNCCPIQNKSVSLSDVEQYLSNTINQSLSPIRANIFFQYKKPEWLTAATAQQRKDWGEPYFRYNLRYPLTKNQIQANKKEQLDILLDIEKQFGNQALVLYASPTIENLPKLLSVVNQGKLIEHTNFVRLSQLQNQHKMITYTQSGTTFKAHSEIEEAEKLSLEQHISTIESSPSNSEQILFLSHSILNVINNLSSDTPLKRSFNLRISMFDPDINKYPLLHSLIIIKAFTEITAMNWFIYINPKQH